MEKRLLTYDRPGRKGAFALPINWYPDPVEPFERAIAWEPGFGLDQEFGRAAMKIRWLLRGPEGVVHFSLSTGWYPETSTQYGWSVRPPFGDDLGYHARVPHWEGQTPHACAYLGGTCYSDGSGMRAEEVLPALFDRGEAGVWDALHAEYDLQFKEEN